MNAKRRVLITGATGTIGGLLAERFTDDYDLVLTGRKPDDPEEAAKIEEMDIVDYDGVRSLMDGVDTVVHMAGAAAPDSSWDAVLHSNIVGLRNVLEAAREAGVRRVIFASSNHAMGMYDRDEQWPVYPHHLPRPDSLYGVSKVFGETLGRFYHDEHGMDFIALRIGWSTDDVLATDVDLLRAMWLSPEDTVRVVRCAIEASVRFGIYYAISDNPNRRWDMTNTMLELGYRPMDSWADLPGQRERVVEGGEDAPEHWPESD